MNKMNTTEKFDMFNIEMQSNMKASLTVKHESETVTIYNFTLNWEEENSKNNDFFEISWEIPLNGILYQWSPMNGIDHSIEPGWAQFRDSMLSSNAPVFVFYNGCSESKYSWAVSECKKLVRSRTAVIESNGNMRNYVRLHVRQFTNEYSALISIRIDTAQLPIAQAVNLVSEWWVNEIGMHPCHIPQKASEPVYSFWYSYHQDINEKSVEDECQRAKELGFNVCIVDDGWQTDGKDGYASCGDWEASKKKFPNMAAHVKRIHQIGMKYVLWYGVPFIGSEAKNREEFNDMLLVDMQDNFSSAVLDPRYKKVRMFLAEIYKKALVEWDLDGFKLDFVDLWREREDNAPYNPKMDIPALQDAVDIFMIETVNELRKIKPDVLIEFRQRYTGPNMRKYGNMFRVHDCPNDYIKNRVGVFDLRMILGNSPVHSDMLMWHNEEKPEIAALQIISVLFSVLQYSAKLEKIDENTKKMSRFWLNFMNEHSSLLLNGQLYVFEPHLNYTWAKSTLGDECAVAVYSADICVKPDAVNTVYVANGCQNERIIADIKGCYNVVVYDCFGECVNSFKKNFDAVSDINVPIGGLIVLQK